MPAAARAPLPPYLQRESFARAALARRRHDGGARLAHRASRRQPAASLDAYVLLDAQDWMTDAQLNALWSEIVRTAKPGARVIFRTAGEETILPGRVPDAILARFAYDRERLPRSWTAKDRSSIYGGFHLYALARLEEQRVANSGARRPPQHMDAIYRYQRYIYDATRKYYLLGRDRLLDELEPPPGGSVLEIACGTGRNLIGAARRYPDARFYGFDISSAMLDTARAPIARGGLERPHPRSRGRRHRLFRRAPVRRRGLRSRVHLLRPVDDPAVARRACSRRWTRSLPGGRLLHRRLRRAGEVCRAGSSAALRALARASSRSSRAPRSKPSSARSPRVPGLSACAATQLYRGYAVYAVVTKSRRAVSGASAT